MTLVEVKGKVKDIHLETPEKIEHKFLRSVDTIIPELEGIMNGMLQGLDSEELFEGHDHRLAHFEGAFDD